jgi:hypothetical protein
LCIVTNHHPTMSSNYMELQISDAAEHSWWHNIRKKWVCCVCPPEDRPVMERESTMGFLVIVVFIVMWIPIGMLIWAPIATTNYNNCQDDLDSVKRNLTITNALIDEFVQLNNTCYANCGLVLCNDCCPACPFTPAPIPPTSSDLWRFPAPNNSLCTNNAYGSLAMSPPPPAFACRFAQLQFSFCGFLNDYSLSLLEIPNSPPPGYGNGTVVASKIASTIPNGQFCVPYLGAFGPDGTTTYVLQGDQTGFTVSFEVTTTNGIAGSICEPTLCSELVM